MIKVWPMPDKISERIKTLYFSIKKLGRYSVSDFDIYLGETSAFDININSFLSVSNREDVTKEVNTVEYAQYSLKKQIGCNVFLSKGLHLINSKEELFLPDSVKKIKTLVRFNPQKSGILSLFPIFYTLGGVENIENISIESNVFKNKFLEYKTKTDASLKLTIEEAELDNYLNDLKFDSDNFIGDDFITVVKSDNDDFIKSKMSVKIDLENYFVVTNISYLGDLKEKMDFKAVFLSTLFLTEKLEKSLNCFVETFNKDFLVNSL